MEQSQKSRSLNGLKIAVVQEWLVTVGGSDKVVKAILDLFIRL